MVYLKSGKKYGRFGRFKEADAILLQKEPLGCCCDFSDRHSVFSVNIKGWEVKAVVLIGLPADDSSIRITGSVMLSLPYDRW